MDALKQENFYTIENIFNLPDMERAELIDGQIYYMDVPGTGHQRILGYIFRKIADYIEQNNGDCEVFPAPFAVFLNNDNMEQYTFDTDIPVGIYEGFSLKI